MYSSKSKFAALTRVNFDSNIIATNIYRRLINIDNYFLGADNIITNKHSGSEFVDDINFAFKIY